MNVVIRRPRPMAGRAEDTAWPEQTRDAIVVAFARANIGNGRPRAALGLRQSPPGSGGLAGRWFTPATPTRPDRVELLQRKFSPRCREGGTSSWLAQRLDMENGDAAGASRAVLQGQDTGHAACEESLGGRRIVKAGNVHLRALLAFFD